MYKKVKTQSYQIQDLQKQVERCKIPNVVQDNLLTPQRNEQIGSNTTNLSSTENEDIATNKLKEFQHTTMYNGIKNYFKQIQQMVTTFKTIGAKLTKIYFINW